MHARTRKLIGAFALFAVVIVWALAAMGLAQLLPSTNSPLAWVFYAVIGFGWVLAAAPLIRWMSRP